MLNILVCGATGFIGRNLVNVFSKNKDYKIHAIKHHKDIFEVPNAYNKIIWHNADLRNIDDISSVLKNIDIVIQAAATSSGSNDIVNSPFLHVTDNAIMNSLLLRQAMESEIKHFIFFSCTVMYQSSNNAIKESDLNANQKIHDKYFGIANTKLYIEKMLEFYSRISPMKTTAIRHSNIYGPYDKFDLEKSHVFGATISKALTLDKKFVIWGSGEEKRDLLHIDDLINFVDKVIENQTRDFRIYNCGSSESISINSLVEKVIKAAKKNLNVEHDLDKPTIKTNLRLDCELAYNELGWEPKINLDVGIKRTLAWWIENIDPTTLKVNS